LNAFLVLFPGIF